MEEKMQVIIVGGFLGSGKTTTIINMGKYLAGRGKKVAIIVNEIGEIGIDGDVIEKYGFDTKEITNGCICCTLKVGLRTTVNLLAKEYKPDILLIEPTGIAFPHVIKEEIKLMNLEECLNVSPLVTLIDGSRFKHLMKEVKNFALRQIIDAEILGINKVDLVEEIRIPILEASVQQLNPKATVVQLSGKAMDKRFGALMELLLPGLAEDKPSEEVPIEAEKGEEGNGEEADVPAIHSESENSIEASGVGSYAAEFAVEKEGMDKEFTSELTAKLMGTIKEKVLVLNPEFIGHIKLFLDNGVETVKQSLTIYSENPQEEIIKSKSGAVPTLKILSAVSNVKKERLVEVVDSSVQEVLSKRKINARKIEHEHEHHEHEHHEHEHHEHENHEQRKCGCEHHGHENHEPKKE